MRSQFAHHPVLLAEVLSELAPQPGDSALDVTLGAGGHAEKILEAIVNGRLVGVDRDPSALSATQPRLAARFGTRFLGVQARFSEIADHPQIQPLCPFDVVLADLGISSPQVDTAERGFSFQHEGPLDMRMDQRSGLTARQVLLERTEAELAEIFAEYGEERHARRIAALIKSELKLSGGKPALQTTTELAALVKRAIPRHQRGERIHPATRVFQALRIAVNNELHELERLLESVPRLLKPGGRFGVISFHSLEDRRVKLAFRVLAGTRGYLEQTRKPRQAGEAEQRDNPRSRSAKLRVLRRLDPVHPVSSDVVRNG